MSLWKNLTWVSLIFGSMRDCVTCMEKALLWIWKSAGQRQRCSGNWPGNTADWQIRCTEQMRKISRLNTGDRQEAEEHIYGVILAIATRFGTDGITLSEIFSQRYNYKEKVGRLEDVRSMKMWITNYINWIMGYSVGKIDAMETNVITKAKRYLADHYDDAELTLAKVAEHVGLSEKYFTNRFTKETGETFSNYLTQLRIQKARELLRTTTFKSYEIGEMVGYRNAEHFTRMFKKETGCTPAQYRKQGEQ